MTNENLKKGFYVLGVAVLSFFLFSLRYCSPNAGISTPNDLFVHSSIIEHIKNFDLFPYIHSNIDSEHMVSKYLPVYHGILGFHFAAALLEWMGTPRPGAIQFLIELCLAITIAFYMYFLYSNRAKASFYNWFLSLYSFGFLYLPNYIEAIYQTYFSQILSHSLILVGYVLHKQNRQNLALAAGLYSIFCYPDNLYWAIPILILSKKYRLAPWHKIALGSLWFLILAVLVMRSKLPGHGVATFFPYLLFALFLLTSQFVNYRKNRLISNPVMIGLLSSILLVALTSRPSELSYYSSKMLMPAGLLLSLWLFTRKLNSIYYAIPLFLLLFYTPNYSSLSNHQFERLISEQRITNQLDLEARELTAKIKQSHNTCDTSNSLILVQNDTWDAEHNSMLLGYMNSYFSPFSVVGLDFKNPKFHHIFTAPQFEHSSFHQFTLFNDFQNLLTSIPQRDAPLCFIVSKRFYDGLEPLKQYEIFDTYRDYLFIKLIEPHR